MSAKQAWIILSATLGIVAGALSPWLLRSPQTHVAIPAGVAPELSLAEFADATRSKPHTGLVGAGNLFHPGRGVVVEEAGTGEQPQQGEPKTQEPSLSLQSIGRISTLACANLKVGDASQVVPVGKQIAGTNWRLESVQARSATLRDGGQTRVLTVGESR